MAHTLLLCALDFALGPSFEVVLSGNPEGEDMRQMLKALRMKYGPRKVVLLRSEGENPPIAGIAAFTASQKPLQGKATAYVCQNHQCHFPTADPKKMLALLKGEKPKP
jgi:uncharacterized protein YyaL (SSP411 family)